MSGERVFRFTTAAAHTPSWPSSSTRFKRVPSATTSAWSHWAHGRYAYTLFYFIITQIFLFTCTQTARLTFTCAVLSRISALTRRCVAWAASSESTTAAWRCRRTSTVRPSRTWPSPQEPTSVARVSSAAFPTSQRSSITRTGPSASAARRRACVPTTKLWRCST